MLLVYLFTYFVNIALSRWFVGCSSGNYSTAFLIIGSAILGVIVFVFKMGDKEDNVYKAKLAEQAERYDGMMRGMIIV